MIFFSRMRTCLWAGLSKLAIIVLVYLESGPFRLKTAFETLLCTFPGKHVLMDQRAGLPRIQIHLPTITHTAGMY
jgi:hypothetical protein